MGDQFDPQAIHRVRDRLTSRRTAVINQMRAFLPEARHGLCEDAGEAASAMADVPENTEACLTVGTISTTGAIKCTFRKTSFCISLINMTNTLVLGLLSSTTSLVMK
jgi:hypothetical protein